MIKGDIVLIPFPFTDLSQSKLRPAIVLWIDSSGRDVTVCFVSSQGVDTLADHEFLLDCADPEFSSNGLKVSSKVRVTRIATVECQLVTRRLGRLGSAQVQLLNLTMIRAFQLEGNL
jgi:mRNA interferase MazF